MTYLDRQRAVSLDRDNERQTPTGMLGASWSRLASNRLALFCGVILIGMVLFAFAGPLVYTRDPNKPNYAIINANPSLEHPFGTDNLGRDTLARVMFGLRVSLMVALYVETLNILLGGTLGLLAGFYGGLIDIIVTRTADMLFAFPGLLLAILVAASLGEAVTLAFGGIGRLLLVAGAISLVSWPLMARLVRSQVLVMREQEFIAASISLGAPRRRILRRDVLPNVISIIIVAATLDVASVVVNEAVLSLLGLGIQPPDPSIGKMITDAMPYLEANAWQVFFPAGALMVIVLVFSFVGDGLRDATDPQTMTR